MVLINGFIDGRTCFDNPALAEVSDTVRLVGCTGVGADVDPCFSDRRWFREINVGTQPYEEPFTHGIECHQIFDGVTGFGQDL